MQLTRIERFILSNQYKILEKLDPENADYYQESREAIDSGYAAEYRGLMEHVYADGDTLSEEECHEVLDILSMFRDLKQAHEELEDGGGVEERMIKFRGFDGNNEGSQLGYCRYICNPKHGRFQDLDKGDNYNSHMPCLDGYRRMLAVWRQFAHHRMGEALTRDQLVAIASARPHPDSEIGRAIRDTGPRH